MSNKDDVEPEVLARTHELNLNVCTCAQGAWHASNAIMQLMNLYSEPGKEPRTGRLLSFKITSGVIDINLMPYMEDLGLPRYPPVRKYLKTIQIDLRNWKGGITRSGRRIGPGLAALSLFDCNSCKFLMMSDDPNTVYCPKDQVI